MTMNTKLLTKTWHDIHRDTVTLAETIKQEATFTHIVAIARGGLVPAGILSHLLHVHLVDTICIKTYEDFDSLEKDGVLKEFKDKNNGQGILIIDDLTDTGNTARLVQTMLPNAHIAVLYVKPKGQKYIHSCVEKISQDTWVVFPWEVGPPEKAD